MTGPGLQALRDLATVFLKLGATAFGGPAAHIALMRDEVVQRRKWMTEQQFLDLIGATNLIPGPNSTEMAIHIGHAHAGWRGLLVAGSCFILPATLIVVAFAWAYIRFGTLPEARAFLYGIKPVIISIVVLALGRLVRTAVKSAWLGALGLAAVAAWLSETQLLDAVAVGQVTPGPVFTTATFIGYVLGGAPGAFIATVGIFLPAFVYVAASAPILPRLRQSTLAAAVLDGVNVASMALMVVVTWQLGRAALIDPLTVGIAIVSGAILLWNRVSSVWLILAGGGLGLLVGA